MNMISKSLDALRHSRLSAKLIAIFCSLAVLGTCMSTGATEASAQGLLRRIKQQRRQERIQKRAERQSGSKLAPNSETTTESQPKSMPPNESARPLKHSLDGISQMTPREFANRFFTKDELQMAIPGFGRVPAFLIILRQLDLTGEQKQGIKAIRQRVGNQLVALRQQHNQLDNQLEEAIYGENFDPKRVEELSAQVGEKQAEITKMQAGIETQMRQVLTPDQFYVFRLLVGEMLLPQRRPQFRPQQQRRMGLPPNQGSGE
jgi:Spy/CpxP family protein refolding chaperone